MEKYIEIKRVYGFNLLYGLVDFLFELFFIEIQFEIKRIWINFPSKKSMI